MEIVIQNAEEIHEFRNKMINEIKKARRKQTEDDEQGKKNKLR